MVISQPITQDVWKLLGSMDNTPWAPDRSMPIELGHFVGRGY